MLIFLDIILLSTKNKELGRESEPIPKNNC